MGRGGQESVSQLPHFPPTFSHPTQMRAARGVQLPALKGDNSSVGKNRGIDKDADLVFPSQLKTQHESDAIIQGKKRLYTTHLHCPGRLHGLGVGDPQGGVWGASSAWNLLRTVALLFWHQKIFFAHEDCVPIVQK